MSSPVYNTEFSDTVTGLRQHLKNRAELHLTSYDNIIAHRDQNFQRQLASLSDEQKKFWFGDTAVDSLADLQKSPLHESQAIIDTQLAKPPFGILHPGELLFKSSGSTGGPRVNYYFSYAQWLELTVSASRSLLMYGVNNNDTVMTTDVANLQAGYRQLEEAAVFVCGAKLVKSGQTTWHEKLEYIEKYNVTVLIATTSKLKRIANLIQSSDQVSSLRLLVQIGEPLNEEDAQELKHKFGVTDILDGYGCIEMGQITFTCPYGHRHLHEDLTPILTVGNQSYGSKLISLPVFNLKISETIEYSFKGQCTCGSYLPTVDKFVARTNPVYRKE